MITETTYTPADLQHGKCEWCGEESDEIVTTEDGEKCLPDLSEVKRTLSGNLSEQKPEPQFSVGNWVRVISTDKLGCTGEIIEVEIDEDGIRYQISPEQTPSDSSDNSDSSDPRPSRNISQHITNCDKQLDNILKDSFRKERRLNIAATTMGHIIQCKYYSLSEEYRARNINEITKLSFQLADALMAKAELST